MKGIKVLMMLMMICGSVNSFAEDTPVAGTGEHTNSCGSGSTCGECVVQGTGAEVNGEDGQGTATEGPADGTAH